MKSAQWYLKHLTTKKIYSFRKLYAHMDIDHVAKIMNSLEIITESQRIRSKFLEKSNRSNRNLKSQDLTYLFL